MFQQCWTTRGSVYSPVGGRTGEWKINHHLNEGAILMTVIMSGGQDWSFHLLVLSNVVGFVVLAGFVYIDVLTRVLCGCAYSLFGLGRGFWLA